VLLVQKFRKICVCVLNVRRANPAKYAKRGNDGIGENKEEIFGSKSYVQLMWEITVTHIITLGNRNKDGKLSGISEHQKYEKL